MTPLLSMTSGATADAYNHQAEIQKVITMLEDIGDSIEIIAREIARQLKADE